MEMLQFLWNHEIDHINGLTTYKYAQRLNSKDYLELSKAMFRIAGRCIEEGKKGSYHDPAGGKFMCLDGNCSWTPLDSTLFLSIAPGNLYFTLDQPFIIKMAANEMSASNKMLVMGYKFTTASSTAWVGHKAS